MRGRRTASYSGLSALPRSIDVLHTAALSSSPGAALLQTRLVVTTHLVNILVFVVLLLAFVAQVARYRHGAARFEGAAPVTDSRQLS